MAVQFISFAGIFSVWHLPIYLMNLLSVLTCHWQKISRRNCKISTFWNILLFCNLFFLVQIQIENYIYDINFFESFCCFNFPWSNIFFDLIFAICFRRFSSIILFSFLRWLSPFSFYISYLLYFSNLFFQLNFV